MLKVELVNTAANGQLTAHMHTWSMDALEETARQ